ncbi:MAG: hypothetical protein U0T73_02295 [Chitinophagales bacterium]
MKKGFVLAGLALLFSAAVLKAELPSEGKLLSTTQEVVNLMINHPDILVVTGKIYDAETQKPITDARINFNKFGDELLKAAIDKDGNYALAIQKKEIGDPISIIFKVEGYRKYTAYNIKKSAAVVDLDLKLQPDFSKENSSAVKYVLNDDPFNTLVIKF